MWADVLLTDTLPDQLRAKRRQFPGSAIFQNMKTEARSLVRERYVGSSFRAKLDMVVAMTLTCGCCHHFKSSIGSNTDSACSMKG